MTGIPPFDIRDPLLPGITALEASAGTGKTWSIAALFARSVAEGVPVDRILVVTFTRAATSELRERIRQRLRDTAAALAAAADGRLAGEDPLVHHLSAGGPAAAGLHRQRLSKGLAAYDSATVATTHGFCQIVLSGLGTAGDVDRDVRLEPDLRQLRLEVADDSYLRASSAYVEAGFDLLAAEEVARRVLSHPDAAIFPAEGDHPSARAGYARRLRATLAARKTSGGILGYDDLLLQLAAALAADRAAPAATRLRSRWDVALVDEFQDTDPIQWSILRTLFGRPPARLVLIGDPKQAIYNFRGADVATYLHARAHAANRRALLFSWRSDQALLDGLDAIFAGVDLGDERIPYQRISAAGGGGEPGSGRSDDAAFRLRVVPSDATVVETNSYGVATDPARRLIARDLAADVVGWLEEGPAPLSAGDAPDEASRHPGQVAVLVGTADEAVVVQGALREAGVPSVLAGAGSVLATTAAADWLTLLQALERPSSVPLARAAARTDLVGWDDTDLVAADDDRRAALHRSLHEWASLLERSGMAALFDSIERSEGVPGRLLRAVDGERRLTDLRHVAQLLHAEELTGQRRLRSLTDWLRQQREEALATRPVEPDARTRRLETDAQAVQILTIHSAKGLEWPVVYLPYLWAPGNSKDSKVPVCHRDADGVARIVDVSGGGPDFDDHVNAEKRENQGERLRLAYVALTRARHRVVCWWAQVRYTDRAPLTRLLFRPPGSPVRPIGACPGPPEVAQRLEELAVRAPGRLSVTTIGVPARVRWACPQPAPAGVLDAARFDRTIDDAWRRSSYSALTAAAHAPATVASEPEDAVTEDEDLPDEALALPASPPAPDPTWLGSVPMDDLPGGTAFGTLVHAALERLDADAPDLLAAATVAVREAVRTSPRVDGLDSDALAGGLEAALSTPLGGDLGHLRLHDVGRADRLRELDFEFPVAGGDRPDGQFALDALAALVEVHLDPDDPLAAYPDRLRDPALAPPVRGYLTGSIDLVLRSRRGDGPERFHVVDYKTNRLGRRDTPSTLADYAPGRLTAAMMAGHYPLQALLYGVALHRYLRWRLPGYRPELHLGSVRYLFLRGMVGPGAPIEAGVPAGVWAWSPPAGLVPAVSDLLDGVA